MARLSKIKSRRRIILLGVLLLLVAWGGYKAKRMWELTSSLQTQLDQIQALADGNATLELQDAGGLLHQTHNDLKALRSEIAPLLPLLPSMGWVPEVGGDLEAAPALLDMALSITQAGTVTFDALEPLLALTEAQDDQTPPLALVMQTLEQARPKLEDAQTHMDAAVAQRAEIEATTLSARTAGLLEKLDRYLPLMQAGLKGVSLMPELLGASGRRTYRLLAQNNDELRPGGGLISAVGVLVLEQGEIIELDFEDSYAIDDFSQPYPDPPAPFPRYLGIDLWVFRDANWSPDFPTSAQAAVKLYQISRDLDPDGVIAVDQHALQTIVAALAPLQVPGWPEPVNGKNVTQLIRLAWSPEETQQEEGVDPQWWKQRKRFVTDLSQAMLDKVERAPDQVDWLKLAQAALRTLEERHVQIWLTDTDGPASQLLAEQGWNGAVQPATSDYLMVVDANLGYNKANALIQQSLDYRVLVHADGSAQGTLTVQHRNPSDGTADCDQRPRYGADYQDLMNRCYWDYLRVYAPAGSELYAGTAHPIAPHQLLINQGQSGQAETLADEHGKAVFASFLVLPHGQETETRFVYQLPSDTLMPLDDATLDGKGRWRYQLLVQKQAGTSAYPLRVTLALPPNTDILSTQPTAQLPTPDTAVFETTLDRDQTFQVLFRLNGRE